MNDLRKQLEDLREECTSDDFRDKNGMLAAWWVVEKLDAILSEQGEQAPGLREAARRLLDLHMQEQEAMILPTPQEWLDATDALGVALGPHPGPYPSREAALREALDMIGMKPRPKLPGAIRERSEI